jgi:hypothetical protein
MSKHYIKLNALIIFSFYLEVLNLSIFNKQLKFLNNNKLSIEIERDN